MARQIPIVGMDPSMNNWGIAIGTYDLDTHQVVQIQKLDVVCPALPTGKQVRQNSKDIEAAQQLTAAAVTAIKLAKITFVEVPVGSQSARAMASYALCVGVLGALRAGGLQFIEVTPTEVKVAATGKATATKKEMIAWACTKHPEAKWPTYKRNGTELISEGTAEHMADAIGAIYAGLRTNTFKQLTQLL